jgi:hypothetical protein
MTDLIRQNKGVVNSDLAAYQAARKRKDRESHINDLERRLNKLESVVEHLQRTIISCSKREEM